MKRLVLLACILLVACGSDSPAADGGATADAAIVDAPVTDTSMEADAGADAEASDAGTSDAGPLTAEQACEARAAWNERCERPMESAEECISDYSCGAFFRPDAIDLIVRCDAERECDQSDDRCFIASELGLTESAESMTFTTTCNARRTECDDGFSDDFCYAQLASTESLAVMTTCLESECAGDTIADCLSDAYDRTCE